MLYFLVEILIAGTIIGVDLWTKSQATAYLFNQPNRQANLFNGFMDLKYTENTGASWGIFGDKTLGLTIFTAIALLALLTFLIVRAKKDKKSLRIPLIMIFAGGVGNLVDRIAFGYVRDFLRFTFFEFPIFNLADSAISFGAVFLVLFLVIDIIKESIENKKLNAEENKVNAEENKVNAEENKVNAEENKVNAEENKVNVEENKVNAEENKVIAKENKLKDDK